MPATTSPACADQALSHGLPRAAVRSGEIPAPRIASTPERIAELRRVTRDTREGLWPQEGVVA